MFETEDPFIVRRFSEKRPRTRRRIKWSTYLPPPMVDALLDPHLAVTDYIICPVYQDGVIQAGVTGTVGVRKESYAQAAIRELGEEVGLEPTSDESLQSIGLQKFEGKRGSRRMSVYLGELRDFRPIPPERDQERGNQGKDNKAKKVGCLIFAEKYEARKFLSKKQINVLYSADNIVGIAAVSVRDARAYALTSDHLIVPSNNRWHS
jgi:ADP-ribose pyrophosphatase YjhB (NUDIX family)